MSGQLRGLILAPEAEGRDSLWEAAHASGAFREIHQAASLARGLRHVHDPDSSIVDILFISSRFRHDAVTKFIHTAKDAPAALDSTYIVILRPEDQERAVAAAGVLSGADGFLLEPYALDMLEAVIKVARIRQRLKLQGIMADFVEEGGEDAHTRTIQKRREALVRNLKERLSRLGVKAEILNGT